MCALTAQPPCTTSVEQHSLGGGRLSCIDVRHNPHIPDGFLGGRISTSTFHSDARRTKMEPKQRPGCFLILHRVKANVRKRVTHLHSLLALLFVDKPTTDVCDRRLPTRASFQRLVQRDISTLARGFSAYQSIHAHTSADVGVPVLYSAAVSTSSRCSYCINCFNKLYEYRMPRCL